MIHVSTAFSNCHLQEIEEKFYDCPYTYEDIDKILEKMNKNEVEQLMPRQVPYFYQKSIKNICAVYFRIIKPWPNTYTFTKALAESMIKETGSGLPLGIFRPAIGKQRRFFLLTMVCLNQASLRSVAKRAQCQATFIQAEVYCFLYFQSYRRTRNQ